ncbi:hypothetical protein DN338_20095 [Salmonella enterica subsp. enterica serovar Rissen]|nr:hypothetical protein [Salmonella enterica subsp. enterica serovar Rissen]
MLPPSFNWQQIRSNALTTWVVLLVLVNLTLSIVITFTHIIYGLSVITLPNVYYVKWWAETRKPLVIYVKTEKAFSPMPFIVYVVHF